MKIGNLICTTGLFNELYNPQNLNSINEYKLENYSSLFWKIILDRNFVNYVVSLIDKTKELSLWEKAVISDCKYFIDEVCDSHFEIYKQNLSEKDFFHYIEILNIYTRLLSKYYFIDFKMDVQDGILFENTSAMKIYEKSLEDNFLKKFLCDNLLSKMDCENLDLVWINGQFTIVSAICINYIKEKSPNCKFFLRNHSSEYFSLNKIENFLVRNTYLFKMIDGIVLDGNRDTFLTVEQTIFENEKIFKIPNLIIKYGNEIIQTLKKKKKFSPFDYLNFRDKGDSRKKYFSEHIINLRLFPLKRCYWRKCNFCGINNKYSYNYFSDETTTEFEFIKQLYKKGYKLFWFEDEAINKKDMISFADYLLENDIKIKWQVRTRFDAFFTEKECLKLKDSGLAEIRFGYESASINVLKKMNKYEKDFDFARIEQSILIFSKCGIHVHLPIIVGFPGETKDERSKTYETLKILKEKYNISFNINLFLLDISSNVYKSFADYNIPVIAYPTLPSDFLGNFIEYARDFNYKFIEQERNDFMRETLYPWYPETALTKPVVFYRLCETIRNTLLWNSFELKEKNISHNTKFFHFEKEAIIYKWNDHQIIKD